MATVQIPITLTAPDASGNAYPALLATANIRGILAAFNKDNTSDWWGACVVPQDYVSTPKVLGLILANATSGVCRCGVATSVKGDAASLDAALTAETSQDITMPATAYMLKLVTFTLATTPVAGSILTVKWTREGAHVNDTLAVDNYLAAIVFQYATA